MRSTWWKSGEWNTLCDVCGFKYKNTELKKRWDGLMVCSKDWETRHPQELIRPLPGEAKLPWSRPEGTDVFIAVEEIACDLLAPIYKDRTYIEAATSSFTVDKVIISPGGIITVPEGITITVRCSLEIT